MDEKIFERVEKKYIINSEQRANILSVIKNNMEEDGYHKSKVFNMYYDTDNYDLILKSIDNPDFKEKLRARSYGGYDKVFLEIKTKMRGKEYNVGYKRRVLITNKDFKKLVKHQKTCEEPAAQAIGTSKDLQIAKEVDYLINFFDLKPRILVYYDRESYVGENHLRITFDTKLKYRDTNLKFTRKSSDPYFFNDDKNIIMEIKAHGVLPLWLAQALSANKIFPSRFSKIGKIYEKLRKEQNV